MKYLLTLLVLLPNLAIAQVVPDIDSPAAGGTFIECVTQGDVQQSISINISSEESIMHGDTDATLLAVGLMNSSFSLSLSPIENDPNVLTLALKTEANGFNPQDPNSNMAPLTGILSIEVKTLPNGSVVPSGNAKITLEGTENTFRPRLFPEYQLTGCVGPI